MKRNIIKYGVAVLLLFMLSSCNDYLRTEVLNDIYVNKTALNGFVGDEIQLTASPSDGIYQFAWVSENPEIASVSGDGLVKYIGEGSTIIIVSAGDIVQRIEVTSTQRISLDDIVLSDLHLELLPADQKIITVQRVPDNANNIPEAVWSSEDDRVAVVDELGEITAISEGVTNIVYTIGEIVKKVNVVVSYTMPFNGPHVLQGEQALEVMAADFDFGGLGHAFNDDATNNIGNDNYRKERGDIKSLPVEVEGNGSNIGYVASGDWYQYTIDVEKNGVYRMDVSLSANGNGKYIIEVDEVNVTGSVDVQSNGSWSNWLYHPNQPIEVNLPAGRHRVKFIAEQASFNLRALRFQKK